MAQPSPRSRQLGFGPGNRFSHRCLLGGFLATDLTPLQDFGMPVFLLVRPDQVTPVTLAQWYFDTLHSPIKNLVWFEGSAHDPPFEEPVLFTLVERFLPLVRLPG